MNFNDPSDDSFEDEIGVMENDDDQISINTVEVDDGSGEMQMLLYHFMSCQALRNRDLSEFINLKEQFRI